MYFSEQGNVDDDAILITIFLVSFIYSLAASCSLQSAVCKCHTPRFEIASKSQAISLHVLC